MTLESVAIALLLLSIPLGFVVEYFELARPIFGDAAGNEPSFSRLIGLAAASLVLFQVASWIYAVLVPRDPSLLVSRSAFMFVACMSIGFAFYAAREVGHLLREWG